MVENLLNLIQFLEGLQQAEHQKMYSLKSNKVWRQTAGELENDLWILTQDLGTRHVVVKFVSLVPLPEQKELCATGANNLLQTAI